MGRKGERYFIAMMGARVDGFLYDKHCTQYTPDDKKAVNTKVRLRL